MEETNQTPKKKRSAAKIVLLVIVIAIALFFIGGTLWGKYGWRFGMAETYKSTSALLEDSSGTVGSGGFDSLYTLDKEAVIDVGFTGKGTLTLEGKKYPFKLKLVDRKSNTFKFDMTFEEDMPLTLGYHSITGEPFKLNLDSINRITCKYMIISELHEFQLQIPGDDGMTLLVTTMWTDEFRNRHE